MASNWEDFYAKNPAPENLEENKRLLDNFAKRHMENENKIVLVTSGGTTIPLEHNTVRFVDNFSAGTRGSVSAEHFLELDYAVIFMHRLKSLEPFSRHFTNSSFLNMLNSTTKDGKTTVTVAPEFTEQVSKVLTKHKDAIQKHKLLQLSFTSLAEYLWLLRCVCQTLSCFERRAMFYLAAAVSDFYIPSNEMAVHKIPSSGPPTISLQLVPKILEPLVNLWVPQAFIVSFKLETDENLLISKARNALNKYKHNLVIANMLQTRKQKVVIVSKETEYTLSLTNEQLKNDVEIESIIVSDLAKKHTDFIAEK